MGIRDRPRAGCLTREFRAVVGSGRGCRPTWCSSCHDQRNVSASGGARQERRGAEDGVCCCGAHRDAGGCSGAAVGVGAQRLASSEGTMDGVLERHAVPMVVLLLLLLLLPCACEQRRKCCCKQRHLHWQGLRSSRAAGTPAVSFVWAGKGRSSCGCLSSTSPYCSTLTAAQRCVC